MLWDFKHDNQTILYLPFYHKFLTIYTSEVNQTENNDSQSLLTVLTISTIPPFSFTNHITINIRVSLDEEEAPPVCRVVASAKVVYNRPIAVLQSVEWGIGIWPQTKWAWIKNGEYLRALIWHAAAFFYLRRLSTPWKIWVKVEEL